MRRTARRLPPLHALRAFEVAARHLSFEEAAEELAVSPTAISHHVRQLEAILGTRLFERHSRRVELTAAGRQLYPVLREGFDAFAHAIENLRNRQLRRVVTLSATVAFTARWQESAGLRRLRPRAHLYFTDESQAIAAAIAGHGVALASLLLVADELERGTLVQPFGPTLPGYRYSLVYREENERSPHVVALREWLRDELGGPPAVMRARRASP